MTEAKRPGGAMQGRPLHFIWICDCSGSMSGDKIQSLNNAVRECIPKMREVADDNPNAEVLTRVIAFSDGARWLVSQPTPVSQFTWQDLVAGGVTDLGYALSLVADQLKVEAMGSRALPPVLVLVTDGQPTDDFGSGLRKVMEQPWGRKAVRIAIAIGHDCDLEVLQDFVGNAEIRPLQANNPEQLVRFIKWASTDVLKSASSPASQGGSVASSANVPVPLIADKLPDVGDVW